MSLLSGEITVSLSLLRLALRKASAIAQELATSVRNQAIAVEVMETMIALDVNEVEVVTEESSAPAIQKFESPKLCSLLQIPDAPLQLASLSFMQVGLAGTQIGVHVVDHISTAGKQALAAGELQIASREMVEKVKFLRDCTKALRRHDKALGHSRKTFDDQGETILRDPSATTISVHLRRNGELSERTDQQSQRKQALLFYTGKISHRAALAQKRAEVVGTPNLLITAAMVSGWEQGGIPKEKIDVGIEDPSIPEKLVLHAARTLRFTP